MVRYSRIAQLAVRRLGLALVTAAVVAMVVFFAIRNVPGDPAVNVLGASSTAEQRADLRALMGLDEPLQKQFLTWIASTATGDFGYSYTQHRPVIDIVLPALKNTLLLGLTASLVALILGLILGNAATSRRRWVRRTVDGVEAVLLSAPQYTVALVFLICFSVLLPIFPSGGISERGNGGPLDLATHLFLPALALALAPGAQVGRSLKTSIATLKATELLPALRARGLSPLRLSIHAHHNALPPMVTVLGIQVGGMLGGALFVENIFGIPGLGALVVQAVALRDFQLVQAVALVVATAFIVVLVLTDLINALLDPRIRQGR